MSSGIDYPLEETVHILFTTRAFATGIPGTLSASTVAVYEDGTATPIETSVAVTEDFNSITGLNMVPIAALAASGYNVGASYHVVIEAGTVDSVSVIGEVIGSFSIGRSAAAVDLANGTDGLGVIKAETALIVADTGELQADDVPGLIATLDAVVDTVKAETVLILADTAVIGAAGAGLTDLGGMSTGMKAEVEVEANDALVAQKLDHLVAAADGDDPVDGSIMAHLVSATEDWSTFVPSDDSLQAVRDRGDSSWVTGVGGTGLTALDSGTLQAGGTSTQAILPSARTFADDIHNGNVINLLTGTGAGQSRVIIDYALSGDIATVFPAWTTNPDATTTYEIVQGSTNLDAVALTAQTAGDIPALIVTADAAIDVAVADLANGTDGLGAIKAETALIVGDTAELQGDWTNAGRLDTILDSILTDTGTTLDTKLNTIDDFLDTEIAAITAAVITNAAGADVAADIIAIKAETAAIVNDTDVIDDGTSGLVKMAADIALILVDTSTTLDTKLDTIDDFLDTEIAAITAAVITNAAGADVAADIIALKAETVLIVADTGELQSDDVPGLIAALNDLATSDILTQVNTALDTAIPELTQGIPAITPTIRTALILLYMALNNKLDVATSATDTLEIHNNAGTRIAQKLISDDGADYSEAKMISGA